MAQAPQLLPTRAQVAVVGAGPAGLSIAAALAERGLHVALISPQHPAPWPNQYGLWEDELPEGFHAAISHRWPMVDIWGGRARTLERAYVRLDNARLQQLLERAFLDHGGELVAASATQVRHDSQSSRVCGEGAPDVIAQLVVDASGHRPVFVRRQTPDEPGYQVAYGARATLTPESKPLARMRLMDWRMACDGAGAEPTFLYAMPLDARGREVFFEETSLVARAPLSLQECERRLFSRLEGEGFKLEELHEVERCVIPMGHALPDFSQRVVGWGGAASMVHPATGYHMARVLGWAPETAAQIASLLQVSNLRGAALSARCWGAIWTPERLRRRRFYMYGFAALLSMGHQEITEFFDTFFDLPEPLWRGYLSSTLSWPQTTRMMWEMFGALSAELKVEMLRPMTSPPSAQQLLKGLLGTDGWRR